MHKEAASPALLELLTHVMKCEEVSALALGGGTSLALRFGHRRSIDLDFFTRGPFDSSQLQQWVAREFPEPQIVNRTTGSLCVVIQGVKVDFLLTDYPPPSPPSPPSPPYFRP